MYTSIYKELNQGIPEAKSMYTNFSRMKRRKTKVSGYTLILGKGISCIHHMYSRYTTTRLWGIPRRRLCGIPRAFEKEYQVYLNMRRGILRSGIEVVLSSSRDTTIVFVVYLEGDFVVYLELLRKNNKYTST